MIFTTERALSISARLLLYAGAGLAARGDTVAFAPVRRGEADRFLARRFPKLPVHAVSARGGVAQALAVRKIAQSVGAEAILVGCERDQLTAALALGSHGGVVRRLTIGERFTQNWRTRLAASRSKCLLIGDQTGADVHRDTHVRTGIAWPRPLTLVPGEGARSGGTVPPPVLAIVAGDATVPAQHAAGAAALRAAARLITRHAGLRVSLLGERPAMQALLLHAASVGLAESTDVTPLDALIEPGPFSASAVWATAAGDKGAVSVVSAMMRRIPVIVPQGFDTEALVAPRITGFVSDDTDLAGSVASIAHLLADAAAYQSMGSAAAARAERAHGWESFLHTLHGSLAQVAGQSSSRHSAA